MEMVIKSTGVPGCKPIASAKGYAKVEAHVWSLKRNECSEECGKSMSNDPPFALRHETTNNPF